MTPSVTVYHLTRPDPPLLELNKCVSMQGFNYQLNHVPGKKAKLMKTMQH